MSVTSHRPPSGRRRPDWHSGVGAAAACTLALVIGACGSDADRADPPPPSSANSNPSSLPAPSSPSTDPPTPSTGVPSDTAPSSTVPDGDELGPTAQRLVDLAVADLVERFDLDPASAAIVVVSVEEVTWRDASLGCPDKDMQYAQVLTPGTRIVLRQDDATVEYHAGAGRDPFYCARPEEPLPDS